MKTIFPKEWQVFTPKGPSLPRDANEMICECGDVSIRQSPSKEELEKFKRFGCGREPAYACCLRIFVCAKCGTRMVGRADVPDFD